MFEHVTNFHFILLPSIPVTFECGKIWLSQNLVLISVYVFTSPGPHILFNYCLKLFKASAFNDQTNSAAYSWEVRNKISAFCNCLSQVILDVVIGRKEI